MSLNLICGGIFQTLSPGGSVSNRPLSGEQNPGAVLPTVDLSSASDFYILAKDSQFIFMLLFV